MLTAKTGAEQFMLRVGILRPESNILWHHEFIGYHGFRDVSDIPLTAIEQICANRLPQYDLNCMSTLMKRLSPLMRNPISFQLITMVMMLDTYNILSDDSTLSESENQSDDCFTHQQMSSFEEYVPPLSEVYFGNDEIFQPNMTSSRKETNQNEVKLLTIGKRKRLAIKERFRGVQTLREHYMYLLQVHCKYIDEEKGGYLGNTNERLSETISSIRKLAQYMMLLMKKL